MDGEIDARGLPCPQPVVNTRKALQQIEEGVITVLVDRRDASENVQRFARSQGCDVSVTESEGVYRLEIVKGGTCSCGAAASGQVVLIGSDRLGTGDSALGDKLMRSFLKTIDDGGFRPARLLFVNEGVKLTTEGSAVLDTLRELERKGVQIFSCGTCLEHYGLVEKLNVGLVTNMYDIVDSLLGAEKAIRI
jgi:selenium metabolism protein YedF